MKKVLVINSSARTLHSQSRKLTEVFIDHWKSIHNSSLITYRELGNSPVPHVNENWIAAAFKPGSNRTEAENESLKISAEYISELHEADVIVLGAPMYNWSVPSTLKAYIDQIMRVNETFKIDPLNKLNPYVGLLENKTLFLLLSRGEQGYEAGDYNEQMNFQSTYLKMVFSIIGINTIHVVAVSGKPFEGEKYIKAIATSHQKLKDVIDQHDRLQEKSLL